MVSGRAQSLLQLAFEQETEHAFILLDEHGTILSWTGAAAKMFGYGSAEMLGHTLERLFTQEDLERGELANEFKTACSYGRADDDRWFVRKDRMRIWVSGVLTALRTKEGDLAGFSKIFRDRTDTRSQIDTLRNRLAAALQADNQKSIFIGTLAHELRNPLGPLMNAAHLIRNSFAEKSEVTYPLKIIDRQVRFIDNLVGELLDLTRIGNGKVVLNLAMVELQQVMADAIETCSVQLAERQQVIELLAPNAITLEADSLRLQQVLINLIGNSSKFSAIGSKIWLKATVEGTEVVVRVEDKGEGIPSELLPYIFELFTQATSAERSEPTKSGLGLGLNLVKSFVELHHGTVQARSEGVGKGAEFTVRLPLKQPDGATRIETSPHRIVIAPQQHDKQHSDEQRASPKWGDLQEGRIADVVPRLVPSAHAKSENAK
jgi:PAS domain S-box-containing protein